MAVMGLTQDKIEEAILPLQSKGIISCSNINTDNQIVIGGEVELLKEAEGMLKASGAKRAMFLNVSAPFHTKMLTGAGQKLRIELDQIAINAPDKDYYPNVTGELFIPESGNVKAQIADLLEKQVYSPVLWNRSIRSMIAQGVDTFVEVFPGNVAGSLIKKIDKSAEVISISNVEMLEAFLNSYR